MRLAVMNIDMCAAAVVMMQSGTKVIQTFLRLGLMAKK